MMVCPAADLLAIVSHAHHPTAAPLASGRGNGVAEFTLVHIAAANGGGD